MEITDLEHLSLACQINSVEGGAYSYASSSSVASAGFTGSEFKAIAVGNSSPLRYLMLNSVFFQLPGFHLAQLQPRRIHTHEIRSQYIIDSIQKALRCT